MVKKVLSFGILLFVFTCLFSGCRSFKIVSGPVSAGEIDSFSYGWAMKDHYFTGKVLYTCNQDVATAKEGHNELVLLMLQLQDTVSVIVDDKFLDKDNEVYDSLSVRKCFSENYNVSFDNDLPRNIYVNNASDTLIFGKEPEGYMLESGVVTSPNLSISSFHVGNTLTDVCKKLSVKKSLLAHCKYIAIIGDNGLSYGRYKSYRHSSPARSLYYVILLEINNNEVKKIKFGMGGISNLIEYGG